MQRKHLRQLFISIKKGKERDSHSGEHQFMAKHVSLGLEEEVPPPKEMKAGMSCQAGP